MGSEFAVSRGESFGLYRRFYLVQVLYFSSFTPDLSRNEFEETKR
jgi:hypothetical protein